jgi:hypothetical protein
MQRALSPQGLVLGGMALVAAAVLGLSATGTLQFNLVPPPPGREPASIGSPLYPAPASPLPPSPLPAPKPSTGLCVSVLGVRACIHL